MLQHRWDDLTAEPVAAGSKCRPSRNATARRATCPAGPRVALRSYSQGCDQLHLPGLTLIRRAVRELEAHLQAPHAPKRRALPIEASSQGVRTASERISGRRNLLGRIDLSVLGDIHELPSILDRDLE